MQPAAPAPLPAAPTSLWDDMLTLPVPRSLQPPPSRKNEWSNAASFRSDGYLARVIRQTCASCHAVSEHSEGIFHVEISPSGARRLQALGRGAQWPLAANSRLEIAEQSIDWCAVCLRELGFTVETARNDTATRTIAIPAAPF